MVGLVIPRWGWGKETRASKEREAEEFAQEDKMVRGKIEARNKLENYLYNIKANDDVSDFVKGLSRGPNSVAKKFSGYVINGYRFHTRMRDGRCKTKNSGVTVEAITRSFACSKDERPRKDSLT
ncbi:uncharacterized protein G2W53_044685 [Senna tora]|uniref:Uncharacterized protein n=1 Tax=Senna tora TaxID=362788 RepID=A0A834SND9_9FABA|nr:uncharacterized protein G2W53_044685 [Senna tora]